MNKHTPGPWEAFTKESFHGWWSVREQTKDGDGDEVGSGDGGFEEADARLIAAAPDLLEALEDSLDYWIPDQGLLPFEQEKRNRVIAAIKKAKGEFHGR